jgi:GNAT superfamily N-acetyltransferase
VVEVIRTFLELTSPKQLRAAPTTDPRVSFARRPDISVKRYRQLYRDVGECWHWLDRTAWSNEQLAARLACTDVHVFEATFDGVSAGYFELEQHDDEPSVEIAYFGLTPAFIGRGFGKMMLTRAAMEAWALEPRRVWLHTCTLDSAHALPNYVARGFRPYKQERYVAELRGAHAT